MCPWNILCSNIKYFTKLPKTEFTTIGTTKVTAVNPWLMGLTSFISAENKALASALHCRFAGTLLVKKISWMEVLVNDSFHLAAKEEFSLLRAASSFPHPILSLPNDKVYSTVFASLIVDFMRMSSLCCFSLMPV